MSVNQNSTKAEIYEAYKELRDAADAASACETCPSEALQAELAEARAAEEEATVELSVAREQNDALMARLAEVEAALEEKPTAVPDADRNLSPELRDAIEKVREFGRRRNVNLLRGAESQIRRAIVSF